MMINHLPFVLLSILSVRPVRATAADSIVWGATLLGEGFQEAESTSSLLRSPPLLDIGIIKCIEKCNNDSSCTGVSFRIEHHPNALVNTVQCHFLVGELKFVDYGFNHVGGVRDGAYIKSEGSCEAGGFCDATGKRLPNMDDGIPFDSTIGDVLPQYVTNFARGHNGKRLADLNEPSFTLLIANCLKHITTAHEDIEYHIQGAKEFVHGRWDSPHRIRLLTEDHAAFNSNKEQDLPSGKNFHPLNLADSSYEATRNKLILEITIDSLSEVLSLFGISASIGKKCARTIVMTPAVFDSNGLIITDIIGLQKDVNLFDSDNPKDIAYGVFKIIGGLWRGVGGAAILKAIAANLNWYDAIIIPAVVFAQCAIWFASDGVAFVGEFVVLAGTTSELAIDIAALIKLDKEEAARKKRESKGTKKKKSYTP